MQRKRSKKATDIVNKSVSFNVLDPDQLADYEFADERGNFSAFCKWLIRMERLRQSGETIIERKPDPVPAEKADDDDMMDNAKGFI